MSDETYDVKISIEDRINTQLSSYTILWPGREHDTETLMAWIEPEVMGYSGAPSRSAERYERWSLQFNCFARTGPPSHPSAETTHKVWQLVDACLAAFDQVTMAVKDWSESDPKPTLFYLRFPEAEVTPVTPPEGTDKWLQQRNVYFEPLLIG